MRSKRRSSRSSTWKLRVVPRRRRAQSALLPRSSVWMPGPNDSDRSTPTLRILRPRNQQLAKEGISCRTVYRHDLGGGFVIGPLMTDTIDGYDSPLCHAMSSFLNVPTSIGWTSSRGVVYVPGVIPAGPTNHLMEDNLVDFRGQLSQRDFPESEALRWSKGSYDLSPSFLSLSMRSRWEDSGRMSSK